MSERQEFVFEVQGRYDEYLNATENRGISYGELSYIEGLDDAELNALYDEILENLEVL